MNESNAFQMIVGQPGKADVFERRTIQPEQPKSGEIRIIQQAIGVNYVDIYFRQGLYPWPVDKDLILGCEAAGTVDLVGEGVTKFRPGDRVAYVSSNGAYATHRIMQQEYCVALPKHVSSRVAAATLLKGLTARLLIFDSYKANASDTVLVHAAAGGVGSLVGQWLARRGVRVIGTAGGAEKCAAAAAFGYDHVIDYFTEDFVERTLELTQYKGVHAVYDSVGKDTIRGSLACLRKFGTLVSFGQSSGAINNVGPAELARASLKLTRPSLFHYIEDPMWLDQAAMEFFDLLNDQDIKVEFDDGFALSDVASAHSALESRGTIGSTVLRTAICHCEY